MDNVQWILVLCSCRRRFCSQSDWLLWYSVALRPDLDETLEDQRD